MKSVNEQLTLFLFKEEALIYSGKSKAVHLLNALGIFIWLQLEEGLDKEQLKKVALENNCPNSPELDKLIEELSCLFRSGVLKQAGEDEEQEQEEWLGKITLTSKAVAKGEKLYKILDSYFIFEFPNRKVSQVIKPLLEQFAVSTTESQAQDQVELINLRIVPEDDTNYKIMVNDFIFSWQIPEKRLLSFFLDRLRKIVFHFSDYYLAAHAAVLAKGDQCFMFPALSYSGKSTLSAALLAKGYSYLSDEMAVLDDNFKARPVPLGLGLKSGSWPVVASYLPQLSKAPAQERWDGVAIKYLAMPFTKVTNTDQPKGGDLAQQRLAVTQLIFPHYTQGAKACLRPITLPQALYELYQAGYAQAEPLNVARLELILEHLSSLPAYQFVFDDLAQAIHCLESLT